MSAPEPAHAPAEARSAAAVPDGAPGRTPPERSGPRPASADAEALPAVLRRWRGAVGTLARLPAAHTAGLLSERLLADLDAVLGGETASGGAPVAAGRPVPFRVVVLLAAGRWPDRTMELLTWTRASGLAGPDARGHPPLRITARTGERPRLVLGGGAAALDELAAYLRRRYPPQELPPGPAGRARLDGGRYAADCAGAEAVATLRRRAALRTLAGALDALPEPGEPPVLEVAPWPPDTPPTVFTVLETPPPDGSAAARQVRRELAEAHAVLAVVDAADLLAAGPRPEPLARLARWLPVAAESVGPERMTLAVDGPAGSGHESMAYWIRRRAQERLELAPDWAAEAVVEVETGPGEAGGAEADPLWARVTGPLHDAPRLRHAQAVARRLHRACTRLHERCAEVLAWEIPPGTARPEQRRARLSARAALPLTASVRDALRAAADQDAL